MGSGYPTLGWGWVGVAQAYRLGRGWVGLLSSARKAVLLLPRLDLARVGVERQHGQDLGRQQRRVPAERLVLAGYVIASHSTLLIIPAH